MSTKLPTQIENPNRISVIFDEKKEPLIVAQGDGWLLILNKNGELVTMMRNRN